ncbi:DUF397 domain-containing protein [Streptomyces somaliensis]|uniref:DUF397 domain-containing protein n=1 Tax=Streptomyces somaliensis TaxID=78355 RepID=UPI0020CC12B1|nr:DUF397 domain-containing protein [Streptomyces somaliensis]MCP9945751.1 DUF397 domain-containing protein [Streptomyces somaliensis]MCP9961075.1 DUF397 domain-containing protein [Streptomyces somaliensis]MCP9973866.1 DUF397 domain-containing protein [Streptomyces somaliensis]
MTDHTIPDASALRGWRKSSHSASDSGSCVEVLDGHPSGVPVRDSKIPHGPALVVPVGQWAAFITALRNGGLPTT